MARVAGTCYITVDGQELSLSGNLSIPVNTVIREPVLGSGRVVGFSETPVQPQITGDFVVEPETDLRALAEGEDMTVVARLANGMIYTLSGAFLGPQADFSPEDGTVSLTFQGIRGDWS